MVKQYTVSPAYEGNDEIETFVDGVSEGYEIISYWEVSGYCNRLEEEGYTKAYDLDELMEKVKSAREVYEKAQRKYDEAAPYALVKKGGKEK